MTDRDEADRALGAAVRAALGKRGVRYIDECTRVLDDGPLNLGAKVFRTIAEALRKERER